MSGGEQQMLAMGRALMSKPKLLLLDEPSMGLAPLMVQKVFETVLAVSREGVTILLIEQNAKLALEVSHRGYVMESGEITLSGNARSLLHDPKVRAAYLGEATACDVMQQPGASAPRHPSPSPRRALASCVRVVRGSHAAVQVRAVLLRSASRSSLSRPTSC